MHKILKTYNNNIWFMNQNYVL